MLVAADVGNSGVKVGAFDGATLVRAARLAPGDPPDPAAALGLDPGGVSALVCVSVSEPALAAFLEGAGRDALVLGRDVEILIENRYRDPAAVGHDRLANAAAAHARAGGAALAVDLGSAVTVDAVSEDGAFLGGPIAPGLRALAGGLRSEAPAMPAFDGGGPPDALPGTTAEAIRQGVVLGLAGLVERLVEEVRRVTGDSPAFLTGGDAERIAPLLRTPAETVPHLTLEGVRVLYDLARRR